MSTKNHKKALALLLALVMCFSLLPAAAHAEETEEEEPAVEWTEDESPAQEDGEGPAAPAGDGQEPEPGPEPEPEPEPEPDHVSEPEDASALQEAVSEPTGSSGNEALAGAALQSRAGTDAADFSGAAVAINELSFPDAVFRAYVAEKFDSDGNGYLFADEIALAEEILVNSMGIASLKGIEVFTSLRLLDCSSNSLTSLDLSCCPQLTHLSCSLNSLTDLDLSRCGDLKFLDCSFNGLTALDLSCCPQLSILECSLNELKELRLGQNMVLYRLICSGNQLPYLDISGCPVLLGLVHNGDFAAFVRQHFC